MMMALLVFKTRCKELYEKNYKVVRTILKILACIGIFSMIFYQLPFQAGLQKYSLLFIIVVSVICGFIPDVAAMCLAALLTVFEVMEVSPIAALGLLMMLIIYFLLFGRYAKSQSYIVLLIPVLWPLHIPYLVPIIAALFLSPAMIPACVFGVFVKYLIEGVEKYYVVSQSSVDTGNTMEGLQFIFDFVMKNSEMIIFMATFSLAFLLVFIVRKGKYNHASHIGIFVGLISCMSGVIAGDIFWSIKADIASLLIGLSLTAAIAYLVQFFRMSLNYTGTRKLQFEDDEYLYYVKAVPKLKVAAGDKTVTRIEEDRDDSVLDLKDEIEKVLKEDMDDDIK